MTWVSVRDAAGMVGVTPQYIRSMVHNKEVKYRKVKGRGPRGYAYEIDTRSLDFGKDGNSSNGHTTPQSDDKDPVIEALEELIIAVRKVKQGLKAHDDTVRRRTIEEVGSSLVQGAQKG